MFTDILSLPLFLVIVTFSHGFYYYMRITYIFRNVKKKILYIPLNLYYTVIIPKF